MRTTSLFLDYFLKHFVNFDEVAKWISRVDNGIFENADQKPCERSIDDGLIGFEGIRNRTDGFLLVNQLTSFVLHIDDSASIGPDPCLFAPIFNDSSPPWPADGLLLINTIFSEDTPDSLQCVISYGTLPILYDQLVTEKQKEG